MSNDEMLVKMRRLSKTLSDLINWHDECQKECDHQYDCDLSGDIRNAYDIADDLTRELEIQESERLMSVKQ